MFWQTLGFGERYWLVCVGYLLFAVAFTVTRALWRRRPVVYVPAIYPETLPPPPRDSPEVA